jgi:hypothetical protein
MNDPNLKLTLVFIGLCVLFWLYSQATSELLRGKRCPHCRLKLDVPPN